MASRNKSWSSCHRTDPRWELYFLHDGKVESQETPPDSVRDQEYTPPQLWCREPKDRMQKLSPGHTFLETNYGIGMPKMHPVFTLSAGGHNKSSWKSTRSPYHLPPLTWVCITTGDSLIPRTITTREPGKYSSGFLASATQVSTRALVSHVHQRSYGGNSFFFYKRGWWAQF